MADGTGLLRPVNSVIQQSAARRTPTPRARSNRAADPKVVEPWVPSVAFATWRQNPAFVDATLVTPPPSEVPPDLMGDYHLRPAPGRPPRRPATSVPRAVAARLRPATDIDGDARPSGPAIDAGSDEVSQTSPPPPPPPTASFLFSTAGNGHGQE